MNAPLPLPQSFFARSALEVARDLIGCAFSFAGVGGRIVETEAYRQDDPCCHGYNGRTARNAVLFGPPGHLYVYFTYGMHFCANVVCENEDVAAGVLLRALEPEHGLELMAARRRVDDPRLLASGPARLAQALGVGREQNGLPVWQPPLAILPVAATAGADPSAARRDRTGVPLRADPPPADPDPPPADPDPPPSDPGSPSPPPPRVVTTARIGVRGGDQKPWRFVDADSRLLSRPLSRTPILPSG